MLPKLFQPQLQRLCCKDYYEALKVVGFIPLCRDLKEAQDELRLSLSVTST
jgi:hypothetical protein